VIDYRRGKLQDRPAEFPKPRDDPAAYPDYTIRLPEHEVAEGESTDRVDGRRGEEIVIRRRDDDYSPNRRARNKKADAAEVSLIEAHGHGRVRGRPGASKGDSPKLNPLTEHQLLLLYPIVDVFALKTKKWRK
jgi:hypothetical protein